MKYKFWLDDLRPAPEGYYWYKTVDSMIHDIRTVLNWGEIIEEISLDNDLGENQKEGYKVLDWLETLFIPVEFGIHIHTANPVARERMRAIIERNGWTEVR